MPTCEWKGCRRHRRRGFTYDCECRPSSSHRRARLRGSRRVHRRSPRRDRLDRHERRARLLGRRGRRPRRRRGDRHAGHARAAPRNAGGHASCSCGRRSRCGRSSRPPRSTTSSTSGVSHSSMAAPDACGCRFFSDVERIGSRFGLTIRVRLAPPSSVWSPLSDVVARARRRPSGLTRAGSSGTSRSTGRRGQGRSGPSRHSAGSGARHGRRRRGRSRTSRAATEARLAVSWLRAVS